MYKSWDDAIERLGVGEELASESEAEEVITKPIQRKSKPKAKATVKVETDSSSASDDSDSDVDGDVKSEADQHQPETRKTRKTAVVKKEETDGELDSMPMRYLALHVHRSVPPGRIWI